jgi:cation transport regulator ChaC
MVDISINIPKYIRNTKALSMLPFLQPKKMAQVIAAKQTSEGETKPDYMHQCAQKLIDAIHNKDPKAVAEALSEAMEQSNAPSKE